MQNDTKSMPVIRWRQCTTTGCTSVAVIDGTYPNEKTRWTCTEHQHHQHTSRPMTTPPPAGIR